mmetsp:Transcript_20390/g.28144  ORF Transcript_20390/g.28144 Transcript_20390/m.28144 type:complete len:442 (+) Transcript_20390:84-1409(+)
MAACNEKKEKKKLTRVDGKRIINTNGEGDCLENATVIFDSKIVYVGSKDQIPEEIGCDVESHFEVDTIMPGLWDCHVHAIGILDAKIEDLHKIPFATKVARAIQCLEQAISSGVTSVRELAGVGIDLVQAEKENSILSPTIYSCGDIISPTAGHADVHCTPYLACNLLEQIDPCHCFKTCDGVPECLKAVRLQLRRNAKVIKICCSGGVLSEVDHISYQQFSDDEIRALTGEANRHKRTVAAHCHGKEGIVAFLKNSEAFSTVEHASFFDEECAQLALNHPQGAMVVPTFFVIHHLLEKGEKSLPKWAIEKLRDVAQNHSKAISIAHKNGVRIAMGTDAFSYGPESSSPWGMHGKELALMVQEVGMTEREAIISGTTNGPLTLGKEIAPNSGVVRVGADADLISVNGHPLLDICVLSSQENVREVWKRGKLLKRDGVLVRS